MYAGVFSHQQLPSFILARMLILCLTETNTSGIKEKMALTKERDLIPKKGKVSSFQQHSYKSEVKVIERGAKAGAVVFIP